MLDNTPNVARFVNRLGRAAAAVTMSLAVFASASTAATVKNGSSCKKNAIGQTTVVSGKVFVCTKVGKKTVYKAVATTSSSAAVQSNAAKSTGPEGVWKTTTGSVAGYRVLELFAGKPAKNPAVGRTDAVTGSLTIVQNGGALVAKDVHVDVDMTKLVSDQSRRDDVVRGRGLETTKFPTASFTATEIALPADAASGSPINVTAKGKLTLHGVTKDVEVPVAAQVFNGNIEIAANISVAMAEYGIDPPSLAGFVTVDDTGVIEFKLLLSRS